MRQIPSRVRFVSVPRGSATHLAGSLKRNSDRPVLVSAKRAWASLERHRTIVPKRVNPLPRVIPITLALGPRVLPVPATTTSSRGMAIHIHAIRLSPRAHQERKTTNLGRHGNV